MMRRSLPLALVLALLLALAGCGGDDDETTDSSTTSTTSTTGTPGGDAEVETTGPELLAKEKITVDFEKGSEGWAGLNDGIVTQSKKESNDGKGSLEVRTNDKAGFEGASTLLFPVEPDETYVAEASVLAPKGLDIQLSLREVDAKNREIDGVVSAITGDGKWQDLEIAKAFGPKGENARVYIRTGEKPTESTFYVDDVSLHRGVAEE